MNGSADEFWVEVREPHTDKLLFRYDPSRDLIQVQRRGILTTIDLKIYGLAGKCDRQNAMNVLQNTIVDLQYMSAYEALSRLVEMCGKDVVLAALDSLPPWSVRL